MDYPCTYSQNTMKVICANPKAQFEFYKEELNESINNVIQSGIYINGKQNRDLEKNFADYIGTKVAVAVSSGTSAIELVLRSLPLAYNDEIITVSHTAIPTISAIRLAGMKPKLVDINPKTYTMCPRSLERAITEKTKAVILVHLYGQGSFVDEIKDICDLNNIYLIEDCSQAHGATWKDKKLGSFGIAGCFSCYPTKNLGALGDAGLVSTNDANIAEAVLLQREYGWRNKGISIVDGGNYRMDEVQASILNVKLKHLDELNAKRNYLANMYRANLNEIISGPYVDPNSEHVYHLFVVEVDDRDTIIEKLRGFNIYAGIHYNPPCHMQRIYRGLESEELVHTITATNNIISLPMYPELKVEELEYVCQCLRKVL